MKLWSHTTIPTTASETITPSFSSDKKPFIPIEFLKFFGFIFRGTSSLTTFISLAV